MIGDFGLYFAILFTVVPELVKQTIAFGFIPLFKSATLAAIASISSINQRHYSWFH
jgi:hypothetical protein